MILVEMTMGDYDDDDEIKLMILKMNDGHDNVEYWDDDESSDDDGDD